MDDESQYRSFGLQYTDQIFFIDSYMRAYRNSIMILLFYIGICYGFEIMRDHESPDIPFTILRTRFPKDMGQEVYISTCSRNIIESYNCTVTYNTIVNTTLRSPGENTSQ